MGQIFLAQNSLQSVTGTFEILKSILTVDRYRYGTLRFFLRSRGSSYDLTLVERKPGRYRTRLQVGQVGAFGGRPGYKRKLKIGLDTRPFGAKIKIRYSLSPGARREISQSPAWIKRVKKTDPHFFQKSGSVLFIF